MSWCSSVTSSLDNRHLGAPQSIVILTSPAWPCPGTRLAVGRGEERQNASSPEEIDLMEELVRRAATYCPGLNGGDKNECHWRLRGAWPGYLDDYASSTLRTGKPLSMSRSDGGVGGWS
ncbi:hypothetical protein LX32DRAFT_284897 [Colletotrichum zoysiae]|uniref:Uncharacterized protein n=1 Tax=Colletotrichum zoysiae TaxID=1216348 RepID=A0AAD9HNN8_9PEZI|nr:hypothetical protein LX32DRAFT_284897 [Colletotrichum zoysiae]